jgi:hypothetical protein
MPGKASNVDWAARAACHHLRELGARRAAPTLSGNPTHAAARGCPGFARQRAAARPAEGSGRAAARHAALCSAAPGRAWLGAARRPAAAGAASERCGLRARRRGRGARARDQHGCGRPGAAALRGLLLWPAAGRLRLLPVHRVRKLPADMHGAPAPERLPAPQGAS